MLVNLVSISHNSRGLNKLNTNIPTAKLESS